MAHRRLLILAFSLLAFSVVSADFVRGQWSYGEPTVAITSISPSQKPAGSAAFTLTVDGKNFKPASVVLWKVGFDGIPGPRTTAYVSSTRLTASITAADLAAAGTSFVSVRQHYDPLDLISNLAPFTVSFLDVAPGSPFYHSVNSIMYKGVTAGCSSTNYCPADILSRAQMSVLLLKAKYGSAYAPPACTGIFADVVCPSQYAAWIEQLYHDGITAGCGGGNFCPTSSTRRDQMAVFVLKTRLSSSYLPPAAVGLFSDVPVGNAFAPWVEDEYNRGIMAACATQPLQFCPATPVQRSPMADFIGKAWAFTLLASLSSDEPNFHIGGAYLGSIAKVPDVFSIFATSGLDRFAYDPVNHAWVDVISSGCPKNPRDLCTDPDPDHAKCGDAHFLFWKHITSCSDGTCAGNDRYNLHAGINNYRCDPDPNNWPPPSVARVMSSKVIACALPSRPDGINPATGLPCRPLNPGTYPMGISAPKVVYVPSIGQSGMYLMAFNGNVNYQGPYDNWRMLWSYSTDASSWQIPTDYLFRSARELTECESGMEVEDIDYDNGYIYVLIGAVDALTTPPTPGNQYYLLRATIAASPPYYGQWQLASGVSATTGDFTWQNVSAGGSGNLLDLRANGYELFDGQSNYPPEGAFGRVKASPGGPSRWVFVTRRPYDDSIDVFSTDSLTRPPVRALIATDSTGLSPSGYGWYMNFTKAGKLLPTNDADLASPIAFWMVGYTHSVGGTGDNRQDYRKVRMSLCGAPPFAACP